MLYIAIGCKPDNSLAESSKLLVRKFTINFFFFFFKSKTMDVKKSGAINQLIVRVSEFNRRFNCLQKILKGKEPCRQVLSHLNRHERKSKTQIQQ